jgi:predicted Zn finger-like uncharacterized protein
VSLATRCTGCGTVFRVVQDQLRVSAGWVRCGRCGAVFNAVESLVDVVSDAAARPAPPAPTVPAATRERVMQDLRRVAGRDQGGDDAPSTARPPSASPADAGAGAVADAGPGAVPGDEAPGRAMPAGEAAAVTEDGADAVAGEAPKAGPSAPEPAEATAERAGGTGPGGGSAPPAVEGAAADAPPPPSATADRPAGDDPVDAPAPAGDRDAGSDGAVDQAVDEAVDDAQGRADADATPGAEVDRSTGSDVGDRTDAGDAERPRGYPEAIQAPPDGAERPAPAAAPPVPAFLRRAERAARWRRPWVRALLSLLAIAGAGGLAVQAALLQHDALAARWPAAAPALARLCDWAGCTIGPPRRVDGLAVLSSTLVRDGAPGRYRLGVTLRNRAATVVRMPAFELTLSDASGRLLVRRVLQAGDFGSDRNRLDAGAELALEAALLAGDEPVVGYTIEIFYP